MSGFIVADSASVSTSTSTNSNDSVVWLSQSAMKKVGIWSLDVILLKGKSNKKMICNVRPIEDGCGKRRILMNSVIRENLGVNTGDTVLYEYPIAVERGSKVVVSPVQEEIARQTEEYLLNEYIGPFFKRKNFVVHESNIFNAPSINGGKHAVFKIIRTTPSPFCEVGPGVIYSVEYGAHQRIKCEIDDAVVYVSNAENKNRTSNKPIRTREGPKLSSSHSEVALLQNEIVGTSTVKLEREEEISVTSARNSTNKGKSGRKSDQAQVLAPQPPPPPTPTASSLSIDETLDSNDQNDGAGNDSSYQIAGSFPDFPAQQMEDTEPRRQVLVEKATSPVRTQERQAPALRTLVAPQRPLQQNSYTVAKWLLQVIFRRNPYVPQVGDDLVYLRQAHEQYVKAVAKKSTHGFLKLRKDLPYSKIPTLSAAEAVKVIGIEFDISGKSRFVSLKLALIHWHTGERTGQELLVKYNDVNGVFDFFILRQIYDRSLLHNWNVMDKFRFMEPFKNAWVVGTILKKKVYQKKFPESHFHSFDVTWAGTTYRRTVSPWDMEIIPEDFHYVIPRDPFDGVPASEMDSNLSKNGIYQSSPEDWPAGGQEKECKRISKVISQVISLPLSEKFYLQYQEYSKKVAYPVDLHLIQARLDNLFYRRPAAIETDIESIRIGAAKLYDPATATSKHANLVSELLNEIVGNPQILDISDCKSVSTINSLGEEEGYRASPVEVETISRRDTPSPSVSACRRTSPRASAPPKPPKRRIQQMGAGASAGEMLELGASNKKYRTRLPVHDKDENPCELSPGEDEDDSDDSNYTP